MARAQATSACLRLTGEADDAGEPVELGDVGDLVYHPDRTWAGRTFIPVTARTSAGLDVFGYVSFVPPDHEAEEEEHREPWGFAASADTPEVARLLRSGRLGHETVAAVLDRVRRAAALAFAFVVRLFALD